MRNDIITVGLGELYCSKNPNSVLICYGLGSCIGVVMFDNIAQVGAMAHVVLPDSAMARSHDSPAKFADTCIPAMLALLEKHGARRSNLIVKLAGGARVLNVPGGNNLLDIGNRNIEAVKLALAKANLSPLASDLGGNFGRTMQLFIKGGKVTIRTVGKPERSL